jgi:hypothetical protein
MFAGMIRAMHGKGFVMRWAAIKQLANIARR